MDISDFEFYLKKEEIEEKIKDIANQINVMYKNKPVVMICTLKGAIKFYAKLLEFINLKQVELDFIQVKSYCGTSTTGEVIVKKDISIDITGKNVVIVEDIIDTGITAKFLCEYMLNKKPASVLMCSLLQKPEKLQVKVDMNTLIGFNIPDKFIIGYGLDLDEQYRNLNDLMVLKSR